MSSDKSSYESVSRRQFLRTAAIGGAVLVLPGLACASQTSSSGSAAPSTAPTARTQTSPAGTDEGSSPTPSSTNPASNAVVGEMIVAFSYVASGSGRVHSPYIAVWVEDAAGRLVRTVSLWYKSGERKYLRDLRRWSDADGRGSDAVISGATRVPGTYAVSWNTTTTDGSPVSPGDYHLCIEAAREDGPYELIRQPVTLDGSPFALSMPDDGELTNATVEFRA